MLRTWRDDAQLKGVTSWFAGHHDLCRRLRTKLPIFLCHLVSKNRKTQQTEIMLKMPSWVTELTLLCKSRMASQLSRVNKAHLIRIDLTAITKPRHSGWWAISIHQKKEKCNISWSTHKTFPDNATKCFICWLKYKFLKVWVS